MALISWLTPKGSIGTIAEKEYFEFQFDAYDSGGAQLSYVVVSGKLATGFLLSTTGLLYGIPVMNLNPVTQESFTQEFAIRAYRTSDNTVLTDRTFNITLNPVALPQIYPLNVTLGTYSDGSYIDIQLLEYDPDPITPPVVWLLVNGEIPLGTTLTSSGRLYGYILPTITTASSSLIGWDLSQWESGAWDLLTPEAEIKNYIFTLQVFDGSRYDKTTFSIVVTSSNADTADNTQITIDDTNITVDHGTIHTPFISLLPQYLPTQREGSNIAFQITGTDLDGSSLLYTMGSPLSYGTKFTSSLTEPTGSVVGDQWWDLTNNQILVYSTPVVATKAGEFAIGSNYIITESGFGSSTTDFTATPTVTPTTVLGLYPSTYAMTTSVNGNAPTTALITATTLDTLTTLAAKLQIAIAGVTVSAIANTLTITSLTFGPTSSVVVTIPALTGTDLITQIDNTINAGSTTLSTQATNFSLIGAPNNLVGTEFTATGPGTGNGYASLVAWTPLIPSSSLSLVDINTPIIDTPPVGTTLDPITIDPVTGWIRGTLANSLYTQQQSYVFQVQCYKSLLPTVKSTPVTCVLTVFGNLDNAITWTTPTLIGTVNGGAVSELSISAVSSMGYSLIYTLESPTEILPTGLTLDPTGIIYGQTGYVNTTLDNNLTTFDNNTTVFGQSKYNFTARVTDIVGNYSIKDFTINVGPSIVPYENLYIRAMALNNQRTDFHALLNNTEIFPDALLYRKNDPWFGKAKDVRFLFASGLNIEFGTTFDKMKTTFDSGYTLFEDNAANYLSYMKYNHFNKSINVGNVKTAVALDANFNVRYEVVYLEVVDSQEVNGQTPAMSITSTTPPYDIIFSNNLKNMKKELLTGIGYADQGALPDWMLDVQPNGTVLGFTYGIVIAYTVSGASSLIAYRLQQNLVSFNNMTFVADRYQLNQVTGKYYLPEDGDTYLKFPKVNSFGGEVPENFN